MKIILSMALIAGLSLLTGTPEPADPVAGDVRTESITAYVAAEYDEESNLVGVSLETAEGVIYRVELDRKGRDLGEAMNGEWIEAEGLVMERDGEFWMTVKRAARFTDDEDQYYYDEESSPSPDESGEGDERWDDQDQLTDEEEGDGWEEDEALEDDGDWDEADDKAEYEDTDLP